MLNKILGLVIIFTILMTNNCFSYENYLETVEESKNRGIINIVDDDFEYLYIKAKNAYVKLHKSFRKNYEKIEDKNKIRLLKEKERLEFVSNKFKVPYAIYDGKLKYLDKEIDIDEILNQSMPYYKDIKGYSYSNDVNIIEFDRKELISFFMNKSGWDRYNGSNKNGYYYYFNCDNKLNKLNINSQIEIKSLLKDRNHRVYLLSNNNIFIYDYKNNILESLMDFTNKKYNLELEDNSLDENKNIKDYKFKYLGNKSDDIYYFLNNNIFKFNILNREIKKIEISYDLDLDELYNDSNDEIYITDDNIYFIKNELEGIYDVKNGIFRYFNSNRLNTSVDRNKIISKFRLDNLSKYYYEDEGKRYYINTYKIDNINNKNFIIAENLVDLGYKMIWDELNNITMFEEAKDGEYVLKNPKLIKKSGNVYDSDIDIIMKSYNYRILKAYNIGGYSLIDIDDVFGLKKDYKNSNYIKGRVYLPNNEIAKEDIKGNAVIFDMDFRQVLGNEKKAPFIIKKGKNFADYSLKCKTDDFRFGYIFGATYELEDNKNYINNLLLKNDGSYVYDTNNVWNVKYELENVNTNIEIVKKNNIKGRIDLSKLGDCCEFGLKIIIRDESNGDMKYEQDLYTEYVYELQSKNILDFDIDIPKFDEYSIEVKITKDGFYRIDSGMVAGGGIPADCINGYITNDNILNPNKRFRKIFKNNDEFLEIFVK